MKLNLPDFLKISCTDMMEKRVSCFELPVKSGRRATQGFRMRGKIEECCSIVRESQRPFRHFASLKAIHGLFFHALFMPLIYFACFVSAESLSSLKKSVYF